MPNFQKSIGAILAIGSAALAGCGGGYGGRLAAGPTFSTGPTVATEIIDPHRYDTGYTGSVPIIEPASFGVSPAPAQIAATDGPSFPRPSQEPIPGGLYPSNTTFPILFAGLQQQSEGLSPITTNPSCTVTVSAYEVGVGAA